MQDFTTFNEKKETATKTVEEQEAYYDYLEQKADYERDDNN
ncbi:MAG: hypothetical protein ACRC5T_11040 [Cetobacterium sp.]